MTRAAHARDLDDIQTPAIHMDTPSKKTHLNVGDGVANAKHKVVAFDLGAVGLPVEEAGVGSVSKVAARRKGTQG